MKKVTTIQLTLLILVFLNFSGNAQSNRDSKFTDNQIDSLLKKTELIPIMINGDKDNRINIVIMNRWTKREAEPYNSPEMKEEFIRDINESLIAALTPGNEWAQTAYANYREFFNVYALWYPDIPEWNKAIDVNTVNAMRDKLFLPWKNKYLGWVTFLLMPNLDGGGGGAARNLEDRIANAVIAGKGVGKMLHEIGHTCISVGDEYTGWATGTSAIPTYSVGLEYQRDKIKWRKWIEPDTPLPTPYTEEYRDKIGAFEGAQYHLVDYFRSTAQGCIMSPGVFDNTEELCPICTQRLAMRVHTLVNPINSYSPSNTKMNIEGNTKIDFAIDHITQIPNTSVVRWILNGKTIATGVNEIDIEFGALPEYELICSLIDETPFIRPDPPFAAYPTREVKWEIINTAPTSKAKELKVEIKQSNRKGKIKLSPVLSGGKPPYSFLWSNGNEGKDIENATPGIYDLTVVDSEFRYSKTSYSVYASSIISGKVDINSNHINDSKDELIIIPEVTASEKDKNNGRIVVSAEGGSGVYTFAWKDLKSNYGESRIYEAEDATIKIPGHIVSEYFGANNNKFIDFGGNEGSITWNVEVAGSGIYPIDIIYGGIAKKGPFLEVSVNGKIIHHSLEFYSTRPQFVGWEKETVSVFFNEGQNTVTISTTGESGVNIDYIRIPEYGFKSEVYGNMLNNLSPGDYTVVVTDGKNNSIEETIQVPEVYPFQIEKLELKKTDAGKIAIVNPLKGYSYKWYNKDTPWHKPEKYEKPLFTGLEFAPSAPGNYYVAAKNKLTNAESKNRIGFAVDKMPKEKIEVDVNLMRGFYRNIKLWFDSSDLDGDGKVDEIVPPRGPVREWNARIPRNKYKIFTKYEPNTLNGLGVCAFDNVWISRMGDKVCDFQTIILVYKESSLTFPGHSLFRGLEPYMAKSTEPQKSLFDTETISDKTKNGKVFLNGIKIDPLNTPNPMEFCRLIVELESKVNDCLSVFTGNFEGKLAEMIVLDRKLSEKERNEIEEYLRKKWFSRFDLEL